MWYGLSHLQQGMKGRVNHDAVGPQRLGLVDTVAAHVKRVVLWAGAALETHVAVQAETDLRTIIAADVAVALREDHNGTHGNLNMTDECTTSLRVRYRASER